ncbi:MAG: putative Ig domain-containing protein [Candidatus Acidiferrales bacterium]
MRRLGLVAGFGLACLGVALLSGCHGGGSANAITIEIIPPATGVSVDVGASAPLNFTAALGDDTTNAGVTWKLTGSDCSGNGCGTLSNPQALSVSYLPPPAPLPSSAALSVTLTATSVAQTSVTQTTTITVEPLPTFTTTACNPPIPTGVIATCGLPGASNGQAYNEQIDVAGGVEPYTFAITSSNPASLSSSVCLSLTVAQTASTSTAIAGKPCNGGTSPTAVMFTVQLTDSGGAAPVTQQYSLNIAQATALSIITPSLKTASLNAQYVQPVSVSGGVRPLTWSVSPPAASSFPPGLALNATNGQIAGVPTAAALTGSSCTPAVAGKYCFSVTVTDSSILPNNPPPASPGGYHNQTQTQAYSITVQQPGLLSITTPAGPLAGGTTATGYSASIQATGGAQPFTWSVVQGQLPPGLILTANRGGNGVISGVPTVIGTYTFTVQVTDSEIAPATQTKTAQYSVTIVGGQDNNFLLQGSYSFIFRGFDKDGSVATIGTLTSDGNGNISGAEVINRISGVAPAASVSGTYAIDSTTTGTANGASGDGRGVMELTTTIGQQSVTAEYALALQSDGSVQFIQDHDYPTTPTPPTNPDAFATHGAGVMKPVVGGGFSAASFGGNYAFEFTGQDLSKKPDAMAGFVHADGTSTFTPGTCDFNDAGTYHGAELLSGEFTFPGSTIGAAEMTLENPQQTLQFEFVFVSQSDIYFIETDSNPGAANAPTLYRLSGEMILQPPSTTFGSNSLSGASVATTSGVDSSGNAIVSAGLLSSTVCDGNTQNALSWDQNDGGTVAFVSLPETCTVNANNGRVAFSWVQPAPPAAAVTPPFAAAYLVGPGEGFAIGSDATVSTGLVELQTSPPPFSSSSVSGAYAISSPFIAELGVNNLSGVAVADGSGTLAGAMDEADASGASQTLDQTLTAGVSAIDANGRGTITVSSSLTGIPTNWIFYVVSPGAIRAISADSGNQHPQLIFLGPSTF